MSETQKVTYRIACASCSVIYEEEADDEPAARRRAYDFVRAVGVEHRQGSGHTLRPMTVALGDGRDYPAAKP